MIRVVVSEHQEVDAGDPRIPEAAIDGLRVGPRVHHDASPAVPPKHEGITLSDIAGQGQPVGWWPAGSLGQSEREHRDGCEEYRPKHDGARASRPLVAAAVTADRVDEHQRDETGERCASEAAGPRKSRSWPGGCRLRDPRNPGSEGLGTSRKQDGERRREGAGDSGEQAEHGDRCHRWRCQKIGGQRDEAQAVTEGRDERKRGDLRTDGECQRRNGRLTGWPPLPPPRHDRRGKQDEAARRSNREGEAPRRGQGWRRHDEDDNGEGQCMHPRTPRAGDDGEQSDDGHHRGPQHTRLWAHDDDESAECHPRRGDPGDEAEPRESGDEQDGADDDRGVTSRDCGEVRQTRHAHLLRELGRLRGLVTNGEAFHERGSGSGGAVERGAQRSAHGVGQRSQRTGWREDCHAFGVDDRRDPAQGIALAQRARDAHPCPDGRGIRW